MIALLSGTVVHRSGNLAEIACFGVGYEVVLDPKAPLPADGAVTLHVHHLVREEAQVLHAFLSREERDAFRLLLGIQGIGPSTARSILATMTLHQLATVVAARDAKALAKVPGIGPKTAEKLLLDLRGKLDRFAAAAPPAALPGLEPGGPADRIAAALVKLGFFRADATKIAAKAIERRGADAGDEVLMREALQLAPTMIEGR